MTLTPKDLVLLGILNTSHSGNLFGFTAKSTSWGSPDLPPDPSTLTESQIFSEILFSKRLSNKDLRVMVARNAWTTATAYVLGDLVITGENNVYQCTTAGTSVNRPTWTSGTQVEEDGTVAWKFVTYVDQESMTIFADSTRIPINWNAEQLFWSEKALSIRISFQVLGTEEGFFPLGTDYRIAGLYGNPYDRAPRNNLVGRTDFTEYGALIGIDTFEPITRTFESSDRFTFEIVLPS